MKIVVGDISCVVKDARQYAGVLRYIREVCRARPNGYQYMPRFKAGRWDGYVSLMHSFSKFPTGLLPVVLERLDRAGVKVELEQAPRPAYTPVTSDVLAGITLRDYQVEAANLLLDAGRGVAKMATNSGKTEVMAAIAKALDCQTIIVQSSKELLYQTAERLEQRFGGSTVLGIVGDGVWNPARVTVVMIQTLRNHMTELDFTAGNQLVMIDECHHGSSDTMMDVLHLLPGAYRFGFSGTPLKHDVLADLKLVAITGDVRVEVTNEYLIEHGYSATPVVYISKLRGRNAKLADAKYQQAYDEGLVNNQERNNVISKLAAKCSGTVLILVNYVSHGALLRDMIPGSILVTGQDTIEHRQDVLQRMRDQAGIFIATSIFDEGVDVPAVSNIILAGGGKSNVKLLQRVGRGMRRKSVGDNRLSVYDFYDGVNAYLLKHSEQRLSTYEEEGFRIQYL